MIMKNLKLVSFLLVFIVVTPFALAQTEEELKAKIEVINEEMIEAMLEGDYDKSLVYYTDDIYSLPSYSPMVVGIEEIKKSNEEMKNSGMKIKSFDTTIKEIITSGDLVIEIGNYEMSMEMQGMDQEITDKGKYLTVWEIQEDGSIKVKAETWNTNVNPWEGMNQGN
jgi:ketosteroid isomerase-like protein